MRSVLEAYAKEFLDPHLPKLEESYRKKLLDEFKDTVYNPERNYWEETKANADKRGLDGWARLEVKEGSKPVAFSPIRVVGVQDEALKERSKVSRKADGLRGPKALGWHVGF